MHHHYLVALLRQLVVGDDVRRLQIQRTKTKTAAKQTGAASVAICSSARDVGDVRGSHDETRGDAVLLPRCGRPVWRRGGGLRCLAVSSAIRSSDRAQVGLGRLSGLQDSTEATRKVRRVLGLVSHVRDLCDLSLLRLWTRVAREVHDLRRGRLRRIAALLVALRLLTLVEEKYLFVVSKWHALIFSHVDVHPRLLRVWAPVVHLRHLILHVEVLLDQAELPLSGVPLDFDIDEQLANLVVVVIREHQPVGAASRVTVMHVKRDGADSLLREEHRLPVEAEVEPLTVLEHRLLRWPLAALPIEEGRGSCWFATHAWPRDATRSCGASSGPSNSRVAPRPIY